MKGSDISVWVSHVVVVVGWLRGEQERMWEGWERAEWRVKFKMLVRREDGAEDIEHV